MSFGERLRSLRNENHLKQEEIAKLLNVSKASISHYERDKYDINYKDICRLADFFGVSADYLMERTDVRHSLEQLNRKITGDYTLAQLINDIASLDHQRLLDSYQHTQYLKSINQKTEASSQKKSGRIYRKPGRGSSTQ